MIFHSMEKKFLLEYNIKKMLLEKAKSIVGNIHLPNFHNLKMDLLSKYQHQVTICFFPSMSGKTIEMYTVDTRSMEMVKFISAQVYMYV